MPKRRWYWTKLTLRYKCDLIKKRCRPKLVRSRRMLKYRCARKAGRSLVRIWCWWSILCVRAPRWLSRSSRRRLRPERLRRWKCKRMMWRWEDSGQRRNPVRWSMPMRRNSRKSKSGTKRCGFKLIRCRFSLRLYKLTWYPNWSECDLRVRLAVGKGQRLFCICRKRPKVENAEWASWQHPETWPSKM